MTEIDFENRFRKLAYNRIKRQGSLAEIPADHLSVVPKRIAFGKNGKGRLGAFSFDSEFFVETWKDGQLIRYKVFQDHTNNLAFLKKGASERSGYCTKVFIEGTVKAKVSEEQIKREIGLRFLTDPNFTVTVNEQKVDFTDIPEESLQVLICDADTLGKFEIKVIDVKDSDRTTQQHGIAWHVNNRLVGECTWKGSEMSI